MSESGNNPNYNSGDVNIDPSDLHLKNVPEALQLKGLHELAEMGDSFRERPDFQGMDDSEKADKKLIAIDKFLNEHDITRETSDPEVQDAYDYAHGIASKVYELGMDGLNAPLQDGNGSELVQLADKLEGHYKPHSLATGASPEVSDESGDKPSVRQLLKTVIDRVYYADPETEPTSDELDQAADELKEAARQKRAEEEAYRATEDELDHEEGRLGESSEKFVKMTAERTRHLFEGLKTRNQIDAAKEEASDALSAIATSMYLELSDAGLADEEIVRRIDDFVANQSDEMANQMEAEYKAEYDNASPIKKKLYDKWSLWGEQGWKGNIKKAAVMAPGLIALGAAGSVAGGAVLGGAAGVGVALLGKSVGRQLLRNKLDRASNVDEHAAERVSDFKADTEVNSAIFDALDASSEKYRKRNRNRMIGGVAISMATGAVLGGAAGFVGDVVRDHVDFGKLGDKISDAASAVKGKYDAFQADRLDGGLIDSDFLGESPESPDTQVPADASPDTGRSDGSVDNGPEEAPKGRESLFEGYLGTRELTPEGQQELLKELNNYQVKPGDTIWDISEKMLEEKGVRNPSVYEIDTTKDFLLQELQNRGYADSRGWLNAGDTIKLR